MAPPETSLAGRVLGEKYRVRGVISEGGMGVVYEAEHLGIGKLVAVKVLHPHHAQDREAISRLRHEARVAGTLGHPNICAIYDMGRLDDGSPYLVLERLHGETLAQRLARGGQQAPTDMVDIMLQVLSALAAAHQRAVIHRDLKPDNIFLSQRDGMRPVPKLLDFGISRADNIEDTMGDAAGEALAAGTPYYMAPEQARGDRRFDARVDLWSAGVVLYEGLTGQRPFTAKNYNALLVDILGMTPRSILDHDPTISIGLSRIVERALAKDPGQRYQSALELQSALRSYRDLETTAPRQRLPIQLNEQASDDVDGTHVFSRLDFKRALGVEGSSMGAPPPDPRAEGSRGGDSADDEEQTPICASADGSAAPGEVRSRPEAAAILDDERTVVETPSFLIDPSGKR